MTYRFKSERRDAQRDKTRHNRPTSRAFLHTLDRLSAERDRATARRAERRAKVAA